VTEERPPSWADVLHYGSHDLEAAAAHHQQEVSWLRDRRTTDRVAASALPDDVIATIAAGLDNLAQGENFTVYRDPDGFRINRSGRPIPFVDAPAPGDHANGPDELEEAWGSPAHWPEHEESRPPNRR
jgi:hypothetical protein